MRTPQVLLSIGTTRVAEKTCGIHVSFHTHVGATGTGATCTLAPCRTTRATVTGTTCVAGKHVAHLHMYMAGSRTCTSELHVLQLPEQHVLQGNMWRTYTCTWQVTEHVLLSCRTTCATATGTECVAGKHVAHLHMYMAGNRTCTSELHVQQLQEQHVSQRNMCRRGTCGAHMYLLVVATRTSAAVKLTATHTLEHTLTGHFSPQT